MKVITRLDQLPKNRKIVLTIGNFDGLHRGHLKILRSVVTASKAHRAVSVVMTFKRHPRKILKRQKGFGLLFFQNQKLNALEWAKIDVCLLMDFNRVRDLSKEAFLSTFIDPRKVAQVVVGYDFHFGRGRSGHFDDIKSYCRKQHIRFSQVVAVKYKNEVVSSNRIRVLIEEGNLTDAQACLGRPYSLFGKVVHGAAVGKKIGVPTANVLVQSEIIPPDGVYEVRVYPMPKAPQNVRRRGSLLGRTAFKGLAYRGKKPFFVRGSYDNIVEVFIFEFEGNLYGSYLEIEFVKFIRKPRMVRSMGSLKKLVHSDIQSGRNKAKINKKN